MAIYLDYAATMPMRPEVLENYSQALKLVGNPSSIHGFGQQARAMLEEARESIARAIGADRNEVIFTAGGTESNNLAIKGLYWERKSPTRNKIVSAYTEHHAVIDPIEWIEKHDGAEAIWVPVSSTGVIDFDWYRNYLAEHTDEIALTTFMLANNEIGIITDVAKFASEAAKYSIPTHTDAVAAFGHLHINFAELGVATMALTAHKIGGPVGVGALIVSRSAKMNSLIQGGGQERGLRSGTMNAAGAKAFAHATELALRYIDDHSARVGHLIETVRDGVLQSIPGAKFSRGQEPGLEHNAHFTFDGVKSDSLLFLLDEAGFAASAGSACQAGVARPSHVLLTMGRSEAEANSTLRITIAPETRQVEIMELLQVLPDLVARARA